MIYLLNKLDFDLIGSCHKYLHIDMFETNEWKVQNWIKNERCRTIFDKQEITELFGITDKVQVVKVDRIDFELYDKIIIWTGSGKYWVLEVMSAA